jgi:DNA repair exonuclease SbcCD nuclease subunit
MQQENSHKIKLLFTADFHLGSGNLSTDSIINSFDFLLDIIKTKEPDIFFILGDIFDKKLSSNSNLVKLILKFLNECKKFPFLTIVIENGTLSHEQGQIFTLFHHLCDKNFKLYKEVTFDIINGVKLLHLPEEYITNKNEKYSEYYNKDYDFIVGHGESIYGGYNLKEKASKFKAIFSLEDFPLLKGLMVFGHVHIKTKKNNFRYTGSLLRDSFGEEKEKSILYIEYDKNKRKVLKEEEIFNPFAEIFLSINKNDIDFTDPFKYLEEKLKKCSFLRIIIDDYNINEKEYNDLKTFSYIHPNIKIDKRVKGFKETKQEDKEKEEKRMERNKLIERFKGLSHIEITQIIAKEKYNLDIDPSEIKKLIS